MISIAFVAAVALLAWRVGWRSSVAAALLGAAAASAWRYAAPAGSALNSGVAELLVYAASCALLIAASRRSRRRTSAGPDEDRAHVVRESVLRQVSSGLAHELRNPLGVIRNAAYLLRSHVPRNDAAFDLINTIDGQVQEADAVVAGFGEAVHSPAPRLESVDVRTVASDVLERHIAGTRVEGRVNAPDDLGQIRCDARQLEHVLSALVQNAVEAVNGNGMIEITCRRDADGDVIEVRDTGPGVPPAIVGRVFEPLSTTKGGRAGLGLARCRQILHGHGGRIELVSGASAGAVFRVKFPRIAVAESPAGARSPAPSREAC